MDNKSISEQIMQHVLTLSDEEFSRLSVGKLAQRLHIDRFKLLREFKHQVEMTLEEFIFKEKMARAAFLLLYYKDISIREVAKKMGFCTCDYFIRVFRQHYGLGPGKYKEYKTPRSWIEERRSSIKDRRQKMEPSQIPGSGERRNGPKDRRMGKANQRKQDNNHLNNQNNPINHENPFLVWPQGQRHPDRQVIDQETTTGNSCENCYFKKFALTLDDGK